MLPEDCMSAILCFTSPKDAFRSSLVSTTVRAAVASDVVWERFLPSNYLLLLSRLVTPLKFSSKKELFLLMCDPVLIDGGNKTLQLEKSTGKISYVLSARELSITWGNDSTHWSWTSTSQSRFSKVAVLRTTDWLEIRGNIRTGQLTPNATYGAYLIVKVTERAYGFDSVGAEVSVEVGNRVSAATAYLHSGGKQKLSEGQQERIPSQRQDGWMEIELGEFFTGGDNDEDKEVKMSLTEVKGYQLKAGLMIEGIELRPKH